MTDKSDNNDNTNTTATSSSSWWNIANSAWSSIQETAKDFSDALQTENEETISKLKESVDSDKLNDQLSSAKHQLNSFLNTTLQSVQSVQTSLASTTAKTRKQSTPKPFEKERATYASDISAMSGHCDKYAHFIETELGLNDEEICTRGRALLPTNSAIRAYHETLVPSEVDEVTFWKRYFYWRYTTQLREILIRKHSNAAHDDGANNDDDNDDDGDEEDEEEDVQLGDCGAVATVKENGDEHKTDVQLTQHAQSLGINDDDTLVNCKDQSTNETEESIVHVTVSDQSEQMAHQMHDVDINGDGDGDGDGDDDDDGDGGGDDDGKKDDENDKDDDSSEVENEILKDGNGNEAEVENAKDNMHANSEPKSKEPNEADGEAEENDWADWA